MRDRYDRLTYDDPDPDLWPVGILTPTRTEGDGWGVRVKSYLQFTEVRVWGFTYADRVNAYLRYLADREAV